MPMFSEHLLLAVAAPEQDGTIRLCFTIIHLKTLVCHVLLNPAPQVVKAALVLKEQSSSQMREELFQVV